MCQRVQAPAYLLPRLRASQRHLLAPYPRRPRRTRQAVVEATVAAELSLRAVALAAPVHRRLPRRRPTPRLLLLAAVVEAGVPTKAILNSALPEKKTAPRFGAVFNLQDRHQTIGNYDPLS